MDLSGADLRGDQPRTDEHARRVPAEADEQHTDGAFAEGVFDEIAGQRWEGNLKDGYCAVLADQAYLLRAGLEGRCTVPDREAVQPPGEPLRRDGDPSATARSGSAAQLVPVAAGVRNSGSPVD